MNNEIDPTIIEDVRAAGLHEPVMFNLDSVYHRKLIKFAQLREARAPSHKELEDGLRKWVQAFGLVSTLHPKMIVDTQEPLQMATQIVQHVSEALDDAEMFRWLTADHDDFDTRARCREILMRMGAMSYSAACAAIEAAMMETTQPASIKHSPSLATIQDGEGSGLIE